MRIRKAVKSDCKTIHSLVVELAVYEKEPKEIVKLTVEDYERFIEESPPLFQALVAEEEDKETKSASIVGFAIYFFTFSTWEGRTLYLEDLYVKTDVRNKGIGSALLKECAKIAKDTLCERLNWQVLDWNSDARAFYKKIGARELSEWLACRMSRAEFTAFIDS